MRRKFESGLVRGYPTSKPSHGVWLTGISVNIGEMPFAGLFSTSQTAGFECITSIFRDVWKWLVDLIHDNQISKVCVRMHCISR